MTFADLAATRSYVKQVATKRGWVINSDQSLVDPILEGLRTQTQRYGRPFCPCRDVDGGDADRDIVCPCQYAQPDIQEFGQCYCGLFLSGEKRSSAVVSIPERRAKE